MVLAWIVGIGFLLLMVVLVIGLLGSATTYSESGLLCGVLFGAESPVCKGTDQEEEEEEDKARKIGETFGNDPKIGQEVCDLKFTLYGELDFKNQDGRTKIFSTPDDLLLHVFMNEKTDHPEIAKYEWKNCQPYGETSLLSLFGALSGLELLQQNLLMLDYRGFSLGDNFTMRIEGENSMGEIMIDGDEVRWERQVIIEQGAQITIPYSFELVYGFNDIVKEDYNLKITAKDKSINQQPVNKPYIYNVLG